MNYIMIQILIADQFARDRTVRVLFAAKKIEKKRCRGMCWTMNSIILIQRIPSGRPFFGNVLMRRKLPSFLMLKSRNVLTAIEEGDFIIVRNYIVSAKGISTFQILVRPCH